MNMVSRFLVVLMLVMFTAPAFAGMPMQMWKCEMEDDATEEAVMAAAEKWLAGAKTVKGGDGMKAHVLFPVAVNAIGQADVWFIVTAPTFEEWGRFWDNYPDSDVAQGEDSDNSNLFACPDSALWDATAVK